MDNMTYMYVLHTHCRQYINMTNKNNTIHRQYNTWPLTTCIGYTKKKKLPMGLGRQVGYDVSYRVPVTGQLFSSDPVAQF